MTTKGSPDHIVVNTRLLIGNRLDGIGIFTREVLARLVRMKPEVRFSLIFTGDPEPDYLFAENVEPIVVRPRPREPIVNLWWQEVLIPRSLRRLSADLYLSPEPMHSLRSPIPCVEVLHDLNYEHDPSVLPLPWRLYYGLTSRRYAESAARIATVSRFSKDDIVETYGIAPEKIDVVYNGPPDPRILPSAEEIERTRAGLTGGARYFYFVGTIQDRKNIAGMMRGFDLFRSRQTEPVRLVIVGRKKWWSRQMQEAYDQLEYREDIMFAGRLDDDELARVAAASSGLLYVPFFEGFGLPILEGWRAEVPVISSRVASIPEVAGDAALLVDPHDPEQIAGALATVIDNENERDRLVRSGIERIGLYSWERTAELLWNCIETAWAESASTVSR